MCGRYNLRTPVDRLLDLFSALPAETLDRARFGPRFNIAPTQTVLAVRREGPTRMLVGLHWGLIPFWAKDTSIGNRLINARSETAATKPSFRAAFRRRRCLVLADGFYEWKKLDSRSKQPYHIQLASHEPMALAGLWETWQPKGQAAGHADRGVVESCTILTTAPNSLMASLHDRMPVILQEENYDAWLDPSNQEVSAIESLIGSYPAELMECYPVSKQVNSPRNDVEECIEPLEDNSDQ